MKHEPAHKQLVDKFLDWGKVENRLKKYAHIKDSYKSLQLKRCSTSPYYCHYIAWRLGTYIDEHIFEFFNDLLGHAMSLPNWSASNKQSLLNTCEYAEFFSLLWELQMAKALSNSGADVEWTKEGPDLKVTCNNEKFYVECFCYRKSFPIELFIEELLRKIDCNLRIERSEYLKHGIPNKNDEVERFLHTIFKPFLNEKFLREMKEKAKRAYPIILYQGLNFCIYLEGNNPDNYVPGINAQGRPEAYLDDAVSKAINAKQQQLENYHPNILAVNFLLSPDFQTGLNRQRDLKLPINQLPINLGNADGIFLTACDIDKIPVISNNKAIVEFSDKKNHPFRSLLKGSSKNR